VPSAFQIKEGTRAPYSALLSACQGGVGREILMKNRDKQDSIWSWYLFNKRQVVLGISGLKGLKTSLLEFSIKLIKRGMLK
jgi:hypothetical protein